MSTPDICRKLRIELEIGITTEVQVVYLLAGIRKVMERDHLRDEYMDLKFHCDWALHSRLDRAKAKSVLKQFDAAHALLKGSIELYDLPQSLRGEIDRISQMRSFEEELSQFLKDYGLPPLTKHRHDGWVYFLHLYARVIEDIPLVVSAPNADDAPKHISYVSVNCEFAQTTIKHAGGEEIPFRIIWFIHDKNNESGTIIIYNTLSSHLQHQQKVIS
jgi:hypothetical protein